MRNSHLVLRIVVLAMLTGCTAGKLAVNGTLPELVVEPLPIAIGIRLPAAFTGYVQKEKQNEINFEIALGAAQAEAFKRLLPALFARTVLLADSSDDDKAKLAAQGAQYIIETSVDSYIYLPPGKDESDYYAARIGYRLDLVTLDGKGVGSWIYEGYGSVPTRGSSLKSGIAGSTALAIRDACANIAAHLPQQELVRKLLATGGPAT